MAKYKKRADGRYAANIPLGYDQITGKRIYAPTIYAYSVKELEEKKAAVKAALLNGTYSDDRGMTVGEWSWKWLKLYKSGNADNTRYKYECAIRAMQPIHDIRLKDLRKSDVQMMINEKSDTPEMQRTIKLTIKQILESAIDDGLVYKNVARNVEVPKRLKPDTRALTQAEVDAIGKCDFADKQKAYVYIIYYTGMRCSEVIALTVNDINFQESYISVNKAVTWKSKEASVKLKETKSSASNRKIPMPDALKSFLADYVKKLDSLYLFTMSNGSMVTQTSYRRFWNQIRNKVNTLLGGTNDRIVQGKIVEKGFYLTDMTAHTFRHNYASMLYKNGVDVKEAQRLLGHANISVTLDIYTHFAEEAATLNSKLNQFKAI